MADDADNLRLLVTDEDDLAVASALLQDAIIPGVDLNFNRRDRQFIFIANRFCWEQPALEEITSAGGEPVHKRRLCAVRLSHVVSVQRQNWPDDSKKALFNLLALHQPHMAKTSGTGRLLLIDFSGGASLRLNVNKLDLIVADLDAGHPTSLFPRHDI
jgi:hypothetical protein